MATAWPRVRHRVEEIRAAIAEVRPGQVKEVSNPETGAGRVTTDTTEQGLEHLICTALAGHPCDPPAARAVDAVLRPARPRPGRCRHRSTAAGRSPPRWRCDARFSHRPARPSASTSASTCTTISCRSGRKRRVHRPNSNSRSDIHASATHRARRPAQKRPTWDVGRIPRGRVLPTLGNSVPGTGIARCRPGAGARDRSGRPAWDVIRHRRVRQRTQQLGHHVGVQQHGHRTTLNRRSAARAPARAAARAGGSSRSTPPSGAIRARMASARLREPGLRPTASPRISRASSSIERALPAARTRRRVFTSSSRLRIVMLAKIAPASRCHDPFYSRLRCNQRLFRLTSHWTRLHRPRSPMTRKPSKLSRRSKPRPRHEAT